MEKIAALIQPNLGPHQIAISDITNWQGLPNKQPIFIFNYLELESSLQYAIKEDIAEQSSINLTSLDIIWVEGQDQFLSDKVDSFWLWDENGLVPFAFVGKEAHKGAFSSCEGVLFINTKSENETTVLLYSITNKRITKVATHVKELDIIKVTPNRELSESIKQAGNSFFGQGKFDEAANEFFKAMLVDPTNPNPYNNIGMITQIAQILPERGEFYFQFSYLVDPTFTNGMRGYSHYPFITGNFEKTTTLMERCVELEPSVQNYCILARFYLESANIDKGIKCYKKAKKLDPNSPDVLKTKERIDILNFKP